MQRTHHAGDIEFTVDVNAAGGRRFRWSFEVPLLNLRGDGVTQYGLEAAFEKGKRAAEVAIEGALEG